MNFQKVIVASFVCMMMTVMAIGQSETDTIPEEHPLNGLVVGGNLGLGFSNGWNFSISPTVGYRITDNLIAGVGGIYNYNSFNPPWDQYTYTTKVNGVKAFVNKYIAYDIYAIAEYEYLTGTETVLDNISNTTFDPYETAAPGLLFGLGYSSSFGFGFAMNVEAVYNILHTADTPYTRPLVLRGGFTFGFY